MQATKEKSKNKKITKIRNTRFLKNVDHEQIVDKITDEEIEKALWHLERMEILTGRY